MPPNSKFCWQHKRANDNLSSQLKKKAKGKPPEHPDTLALNEYDEIKNESAPPPTKFSALVLRLRVALSASLATTFNESTLKVQSATVRVCKVLKM